MTDSMNSNSSRHDCSLCQTGFLCNRLQSAMKVLESYTQKNSLDEKASEELAQILEKIHEFGWDYNNESSPCSLVEDAEAVRIITERVISLLQSLERRDGKRSA